MDVYRGTVLVSSEKAMSMFYQVNDRSKERPEKEKWD